MTAGSFEARLMNALNETSHLMKSKITNIEIERLLEETEQKVIDFSENNIRSAFNAKRFVLKFLNDVREKHQVSL